MNMAGMNISRRTWTAAAVASMACWATGARAQAYPDKPVRLALPFPPGGSADTIARLLADQLRVRTGQPFLVENRPGASGNLATSYVAKTPNDGYSLLIGVTGAMAINPSLYRDLDYVPERDFTAISMIARAPVAVVASPASGVTSVRQLVELAKGAPGKYTYATNGVGTSHHLAAELFKGAAKIDIRNVPYKGTPGALQDIVGGRVDFGFIDLTASIPLVTAGRIKGLATTGATRSAALPDVPTIAESGYPGFDAVTWIALFGPRGMAPDVVQKLNTEVNAVLADEEVRKKGVAQGLDVAGSTALRLQQFLAEENAKWRKVVAEAGIKPE